jgi:hypothetical protein
MRFLPVPRGLVVVEASRPRHARREQHQHHQPAASKRSLACAALCHGRKALAFARTSIIRLGRTCVARP